MGGASVLLMVEVANVDIKGISEEVITDLASTYVHDIAFTLGFNGSSLKDMFGTDNSASVEVARVAGSPGLKVSAYTLVPDSSSARELAVKLYTADFRTMIEKTTSRVFLQHGQQHAVLGYVRAPVVVVKPEKFHPLVLTTTRTTEATTEATTDLPTTMEVTTSIFQHDLQSEASTTGFLASTVADLETSKEEHTRKDDQSGQATKSGTSGKFGGLSQFFTCFWLVVMSLPV